MNTSSWPGLQSGPQTPGPDMAGSPKQFAHPQHTSDGVPPQNNPSDTNAQSYQSTPVAMDYSCDMGND